MSGIRIRKILLGGSQRPAKKCPATPPACLHHQPQPYGGGVVVVVDAMLSRKRSDRFLNLLSVLFSIQNLISLGLRWLASNLLISVFVIITLPLLSAATAMQPTAARPNPTVSQSPPIIGTMSGDACMPHSARRTRRWTGNGNQFDCTHTHRRLSESCSSRVATRSHHLQSVVTPRVCKSRHRITN